MSIMGMLQDFNLKEQKQSPSEQEMDTKIW